MGASRTICPPSFPKVEPEATKLVPEDHTEAKVSHLLEICRSFILVSDFRPNSSVLQASLEHVEILKELDRRL